jgi:hypothetical protein
MKTKFIILLGLCAVITLSFTFVNVNDKPKRSQEKSIQPNSSNAPIGGLVIDNKY